MSSTAPSLADIDARRRRLRLPLSTLAALAGNVEYNPLWRAMAGGTLDPETLDRLDSALRTVERELLIALAQTA